MVNHSVKDGWSFFFLVTLIVIVFRGAASDLISLVLADPGKSYIFLVPMIVFYLVWLRRNRFNFVRPSKSISGPVVLIAAIVLMQFGYALQLRALLHICVVLAILGAFLTFVGPRVLLAVLPAVVALFFIVPLPGNVRQWLAIPLQRFATEVTVFLLEVMSVPAFKSGNLIEINGAAVAVGEACDGMRLVVPLALVIYAFVFSLPMRTHLRIFLVLVSVPIALICNVVRLVPTAIAFGYFPDHAGFIHDLGGWLMIPLAIILLRGFVKTLFWLELPVSRWRLVTA